MTLRIIWLVGPPHIVGITTKGLQPSISFTNNAVWYKDKCKLIKNKENKKQNYDNIPQHIKYTAFSWMIKSHSIKSKVSKASFHHRPQELNCPCNQSVWDA